MAQRKTLDIGNLIIIVGATLLLEESSNVNLENECIGYIKLHV